MSGAISVRRFVARSMRVGMPALAAFACALPARRDDGDRRPYLPPGCESLEVSEDNDVSFHGYAQGVQIYQWDASTSAWLFVAPEATLYSDAGFHGQIATHFAGPTWLSNSGSNVVGKKLVACTPDATAIPWLKLSAVSSAGPGPLDQTTFIQRVATTGGLAPTTPGAPGDIARVPYTAEYYFYRAK